MPEPARPAPLIGITVNRDYCQERFWVPGSYSRCIEEAGAIPLLLPPLDPAAAATLAGSLHGLLLSGGADIAPLHYGKEPEPGLDEVDPQRDAWELALVRAARARDLPLFGICRGLQLLNVALGGTLLQDLSGPDRLQHYQKAPRCHPAHTVKVLPSTFLAQLLGEGSIAVSSFHHQAPAEIAPGLRAAAVAPDGIIEALEGRTGFLMAVQWHPEALDHPVSRILFHSFVTAASLRL